MPTYPIYHQNWDGGTGSYPPGYGDWNLAGIPSGFSIVGTPLTSSPDSLGLTDTNAVLSTFVKTNSESSADGTCTFYCKNTAQMSGILIGCLARCQGVSTVAGDYPCYFALFQTEIYDPLGTFRISKGNGDSTITNLAVSSTYGTNTTSIYVVELRLSGTSLKTRVYDRTLNLWLQSNGSWSATPADVLSITDSSVSAAGRVGVGYFTSGSSGDIAYIDDFYWDSPTPVLSQSTASLGLGGGTVTLTAGGFSDPLAGVTWGSSNTGVATVSGGVVTPVAVGSATITATGVADVGQTASCLATVSIIDDGPMFASRSAISYW